MMLQPAPSLEATLGSALLNSSSCSGFTKLDQCFIPRTKATSRLHMAVQVHGAQSQWNGHFKELADLACLTPCSLGYGGAGSRTGHSHLRVSAIHANPLGKDVENLSRLVEIKKEKVGVLLLNLGGPETLDDVQPFLYNLFADPDIIRLPRLLRSFQKPFAQLISVVRAPKSKEGYAAIGGGSPLRKITEEQANALREALQKKNLSANVYIGMRYWHPFTEEAIEKIKMDGITRLVVLPLYPQFSISTSGSSLRLLEEVFRNDEYFANLQHTVIPSWYQREGYVKAMSTLIDRELNTFEQPSKVVIFFSAHGVPRNYVEEAGDPYKDEMENCVNLIMTELKQRGIQNEYTLAYQSRVGPAEWLRPYTDETIRELGQQGVKSLLAVPISFVSEHIETLEEIDVEYKELAMESGIVNWGRVPALGCECTFIEDLADAVIENLPQAGPAAVPNPKAWTISRTLQDYFLPYGGRAWMEWLSGS